MYVLGSLAATKAAPTTAKATPAAAPALAALAALAVLGEVRRPRVREVRRRARLVDDVGLAPQDDRDAALARALLLRQQVDAVLESNINIAPEVEQPACAEIKILRRVRDEPSRRPPRHRRDACSMVWRCRFLTARRSQHGRTRHTG